MKIDPSIFKAYDIRGIYPDLLNEDIAYKIGLATAKVVSPKKAVFGKDVRLASNRIYKHLIEGLLDGGVDVDFIGDVTTDMIYFAVGKYGYELGVQVTGSHNPKEYTGVKLVKKGVVAISGDSGIYDIKDMVLSKISKAKKRGKLEEKNLDEPYVNYVLSFIDTASIKPLKIALDTGNGVAGPIFLKTLSKLPVKVNSIYTEKDGRFPNHLPDPLKKENVVDLVKLVKKENSDLGIAVDGDGDRVFFVDSKGRYHVGYFTICLLSKVLLKDNLGAKIIYDPRFTWAIIDTVKNNGGKPLLNKVGHSFIKERMRKEDALFAGESSSHLYFKDNYYADNGLIPALLILELLSKENKTSAELYDYYVNNYFFAGEFNTAVKNPDLIIKDIKKKYFKDYKIDETDGITVENGRIWRFNVRKSNTEPLLRLNVEAKSKEMVDKTVREVLNKIESY